MLDPFRSKQIRPFPPECGIIPDAGGELVFIKAALKDRYFGSPRNFETAIDVHLLHGVSVAGLPGAEWGFLKNCVLFLWFTAHLRGRITVNSDLVGR